MAQETTGQTRPIKAHGHEVINPALDDDDFDAAQAEFDKHQSQVVVESSRGGAVAMNINSGDAKLVLLCPAWKNWGTVKTVRSDTVILHSRADDVIPFADSEELVRNSGLPAYTLMEIGNDHRLADPESLDLMLDRMMLDRNWRLVDGLDFSDDKMHRRVAEDIGITRIDISVKSEDFATTTVMA